MMPEQITINSEIDDIFEILGLLYVSNHFDRIKEETIESLNDIGLEGLSFYNENFKIYEKYIQEFSKKKTMSKSYELFFGEHDLKFFILTITLIIENRNVMTFLPELSDRDINNQLLNYYSDIYEEEISVKEIESYDDIINFLSSCKASNSSKWRLMNLMSKPKEYYKDLISFINDNTDAYKNTLAKIGLGFNKMIKDFKTNMIKKDDKDFFNLLDNIHMPITVNPMLIFPISQIMFNKYSYYGLLSGKTLKKGSDRESIKENLILKMKALSDPSKFEILLSLKEAPKYNLEMAEDLKLSPSTMSHHMNALLSCGLVGVKKIKGKVYYNVEKNNIYKLTKNLEEFLIDV